MAEDAAPDCQAALILRKRRPLRETSYVRRSARQPWAVEQLQWIARAERRRRLDGQCHHGCVVAKVVQPLRPLGRPHWP